MRIASSILALLLATTAALPVKAQTIEDLTEAETAYSQIWDQMALTFRNVHFVTEATGFGVYTDKPDSVFTANEKIVLYVEPVGFNFAKADDGLNSFGLKFDFTLKNAAGDTITQQADFLKTELKSHSENHEFYLTLSLNLTGAPADDYVLEYVGHDLSSDETATITMPFTIAAP